MKRLLKAVGVVLALTAILVAAALIGPRYFIMLPMFYMGGMVATGVMLVAFGVYSAWGNAQEDRRMVEEAEKRFASSEKAAIGTWKTAAADFFRTLVFATTCALLGGVFLYFAGHVWPVLFL